MKKALILFCILGLTLRLLTAQAGNDSTGTRTKTESTGVNAGSIVLYGKYNNTIVPLKTSADGTVATSGGGGSGTPGGNTTEVQFNDGGSFAGDSAFVFNKTSDVLSVGSISTTSSDGSNKILMNNNSAISPTASSDEIYFEANVLKVNENGTEKTVIDSTNTPNDLAAATGNIPGLPFHWHIPILNPNAQITTSAIVPIGVMDSAVTITKIRANTSSASYEATGDLKWAEDRQALTNATVVNDFDTTNGTRMDDSITAGSVASSRFMYLSFDAVPNANMTDVTVDIKGTH